MLVFDLCVELCTGLPFSNGIYEIINNEDGIVLIMIWIMGESKMW